MKGFVIDTSVAVKWAVPEPGWEKARRLLASNIRRIAPDLIYTEIVSALRGKLRPADGSLTPDEAFRALRLLLRVPINIEPASHYAHETLEASLLLDCPVYDPTFLVLAIARRCKLVTADRIFYERVEATSLHKHITLLDDMRE